jgi:RNA polymerase sigma-70 factor (ECF subfamily)
LAKPKIAPARIENVTAAFSTCGTLADGGMLARWMSPNDQAPLEQAMTRFAGGDDAALGEIYDLASPALFTFLFRICRDRSLAEDLTQETFMRIHRARGLYRPGAAVMPWAYTIARRLFLDAVRARKTEDAHVSDAGARDGDAAAPEIASTGPSAEDLLADAEIADAVDSALARIPENQATAFRLLKSEGLSVAETAAIMGTTKGAVKLRAHRAYEALRGILTGHFPAMNAKRNTRRGTV